MSVATQHVKFILQWKHIRRKFLYLYTVQHSWKGLHSFENRLCHNGYWPRERRVLYVLAFFFLSDAILQFSAYHYIVVKEAKDSCTYPAINEAPCDKWCGMDSSAALRWLQFSTAKYPPFLRYTLYYILR